MLWRTAEDGAAHADSLSSPVASWVSDHVSKHLSPDDTDSQRPMALGRRPRKRNRRFLPSLFLPRTRKSLHPWSSWAESDRLLWSVSKTRRKTNTVWVTHPGPCLLPGTMSRLSRQSVSLAWAAEKRGGFIRIGDAGGVSVQEREAGSVRLPEDVDGLWLFGRREKVEKASKVLPSFLLHSPSPSSL
jgi:hypothetical protein